ncbi:MAG TPA: Yip1 family protein [Bacteroidales bacterium]|jgi:hypothetical protein|nr:Yip1 family protein [Bacteroidales bacterium]HOS71298.1 Yip1 family protein [Bacteroidales bacterium]HQH23959.1 Yip1 family protein [Bacteroidales bacterium]HQJ81289.1 Yip1 family protein [Bacteroidales bacterium]
MSNSSFDFNALIRDSKEILKDPKAYFSSMKTTGGIAEPVIKAVVYGLVAGIFAFIWSLLKIGPASYGISGGAVGFMALVWYVVGAVIGLFIGAVILLVISAICKGSTDFESNVRVTAALMVMMPISAFLGFFMGIGITLGTIVSLIVSLYGLYLLYHGLIETLKANAGTSRVLVLVLAALLVIFSLVGIGARKKAASFMGDFNMDQIREFYEDAGNN